MTKTSTPELDELWEKIQEHEWKLIDLIETMIKTKWNAPKLKKDIEKKVKEADKMDRKFDELYTKMEQEKEEESK